MPDQRDASIATSHVGISTHMFPRWSSSHLRTAGHADRPRPGSDIAQVEQITESAISPALNAVGAMLTGPTGVGRYLLKPLRSILPSRKAPQASLSLCELLF